MGRVQRVRAADHMPQLGRGVVVAALDHPGGRHPLPGGRLPAGVLAAQQQREEDAELDDAGGGVGGRRAPVVGRGTAGGGVADGDAVRDVPVGGVDEWFSAGVHGVPSVRGRFSPRPGEPPAH